MQDRWGGGAWLACDTLRASDRRADSCWQRPCDWFAEAFDTCDLQDAKALFDEFAVG